MSDDGRRVRRLGVPRWLVPVACGALAVALLANLVLVARYTSLRRARVASVAALSEVAAVPGEHAGAAIVAAVTPAERATDQRPATDSQASTTAPAASGTDELATTRDELAKTRAQLTAAREQLAQKSRLLEPLERRIAEVRDELRNWDGLHTAILKPLSGERSEPRGRTDAATERGRGKADGNVVDAASSVLATVRQESNRLRALARITREAAEIIAAVPSRLPLRAAINSGFGMRPDPFGAGPQFHAGIDLAASPGTPVAAAAGGVVMVAGAAAGYGTTVWLDHGRGFETRYGHLDSVRVAKGQRVERGQPIGLSGNTGRSTAPHLHYEVLVDGRPVDPRRLIRD